MPGAGRDVLRRIGAALLPSVVARRAPAVTSDDAVLDSILGWTGVPALAGVVATKDGVVWLRAAGLRRRGGPEATAADDLWHLGSNTKAMTAALYARLVDEGRARWGAVIPELFPDLRPDPAWAGVTVERLMAHRAGVIDRGLVNPAWLTARHEDARPPRDQRTAFAAAILAAPPRGRPGSFGYANASYVLLGAAIERLGDAGWEEAVAAGLFRPLGMASAGFGAPAGAQPWGHDGRGPVDPSGLADNPAVLGPAGRVHASLTGYAAFLRLFLNDGGAYLRPATLAHLLVPPPGRGETYAGGWIIRTPRWGQGPVHGHEGSNTLWHAVVLVAPRRGLAFATVANQGGPAGARAARSLAERLVGIHGDR